MPAYNREQKRIAALMAGDNAANFGTWIPEDERNQDGTDLRQNPAVYNVQGSQNASRAIMGERPMLGDALKPTNNYQDAIRRRLAGISGLSETANAQAFAAANARAQQAAQINLPPVDPNAASQPAYSGSVDDRRKAVLAAAARSVGLPYSWGGGNSKGASYGLSGAGERHNSSKIYGFDCSGLVQYAYAQAGIKLPRLAGQQAARGIRAPINKLVPGDLVGKPGHIAIYAGNGMMYEAPTFGKRVRLVPVRSGMFGVHFNY